MERDKQGNEAEGQVKTYSEAEFGGLLADKQAEVKKRQEAEKRASDLETELEKLKKIDPHAPGAEGEVDPDDKPLTMNDLVNLLGGEEEDEPATAAPKTGGRVAGGVPGISLPWFRRNRDKPVSQMTDAQLDRLAMEVE